jgi:hypothetical protein
LAALPLGYAGRTTVGWGRRLAGAPADAVLTGVQQATAEQVFRTLGELKGGAMKFGQAMSVFEAAMPEELARPYRETLTKLQDAAPPMEPATVRRVLARELGSSWRTKFATFDEDPAAAASIGQVHRARWHDGREVAVKLQYPGAKEALESDLRQISRVARLLGSMMPGIEIGPLLTELRERIVEELDYDLEAQAQAVFAAAYEGDPGIVVPSVVMHTPRLLVTTWMDSEYSLARLIAEGTQRDRDRYGAAYVHFLFSGPRRTGLLHADPHPGNFRIIGDGRLGVVDFGAVARFPAGSILWSSAACCAERSRTTTTPCWQACVPRASSAPESTSTPRCCARTSPLRRTGPRGELPLHPGLAARAGRAGQQPAQGGLRDGTEDQPAAGVSLAAPCLGGGHRSAEPAGCAGTVSGDLEDALPGFGD